jgi:ribonuclease III
MISADWFIGLWEHALIELFHSAKERIWLQIPHPSIRIVKLLRSSLSPSTERLDIRILCLPPATRDGVLARALALSPSVTGHRIQLALTPALSDQCIAVDKRVHSGDIALSMRAFLMEALLSHLNAPNSPNGSVAMFSSKWSAALTSTVPALMSSPIVQSDSDSSDLRAQAEVVSLDIHPSVVEGTKASDGNVANAVLKLSSRALAHCETTLAALRKELRQSLHRTDAAAGGSADKLYLELSSRTLAQLEPAVRWDERAVLTVVAHSSYLGGLGTVEEGDRQYRELLTSFGKRILQLAVVQELLVDTPFELYNDQLNRRTQIVLSSAVYSDYLDRIGLSYPLFGRGLSREDVKVVTFHHRDIVYRILGTIAVEVGVGKALRLYRERFAFCKDFPYESHMAVLYKSTLQDVFQRARNRTPTYVIESEEGPDHSKVFTVSVNGVDHRKYVGKGLSLADAETCAASEALRAHGVPDQLYAKRPTGLTKTPSDISVLGRLREAGEAVFKKLRLRSASFPGKDLDLLGLVFSTKKVVSALCSAHSFSGSSDYITELRARLGMMGANLLSVFVCERAIAKLKKDVLEEIVPLTQWMSAALDERMKCRGLELLGLDCVIRNVENDPISVRMKADVFDGLVGLLGATLGIQACRLLTEPLLSSPGIESPGLAHGKAALQDIIQKLRRDAAGATEAVSYKVLRNSHGPGESWKVVCIVDGESYETGEAHKKRHAEEVAAQKTMESAKFIKKYIKPEKLAGG